MSAVRMFLVVAILVASCASCSGKATSGNSPGPSTSSSTSATPSVPPYLASYTADERQAYADAVAAYATYVERNNRLLAKGKTTVGASDFYHRYSTDWATAWANLAQLANNHVTVRGHTTVTWVRPISVKLKGQGATVELRRCLDESALVVTQSGEPLAQPNLQKPHVYRVRLELRSAETWWRSGSAKRSRG